MKERLQTAGPLIGLLLITVAGCAVNADKGPLSDNDVGVVVNELEGIGFIGGELGWCDLYEGALPLHQPFQLWGFYGADCPDTFIDLASRDGNDMFLILLSHPRAGGPWVMAGFNDDCYPGTLNACLELTTSEDEEYILVATTYRYAQSLLAAYYGFAVRIEGETVENYHLRLVCRNEADECSDPTETPIPCGSDLPSCAEGSYCNWDDNSCGADDVTGVCEPIPEGFCPAVYEPVCGCDGETYSNDCVASQNGVDVHTDGECVEPEPEDVLCGSRGLPPCADGFYCDWEDSSCGAVDVPGVCLPIPEFCFEIYSPVCGCDGETYGNECEAAANGIDVHTIGECEEPEPEEDLCGSGLPRCAAGFYCDWEDNSCGADDMPGVCVPILFGFCPMVWEPVCGCNGMTYSNACVAAQLGVDIQSFGVCERPL